jgi:uncharacterized protein
MLIHPSLVRCQKDKNEDYYSAKFEYLRQHLLQFDDCFTLTRKVTPQMVFDSLATTPSVVFEVTDMCNLKCKYCAFGEMYEMGRDRHFGNIEIEKAKLLLKYLFNIRKVQLNNEFMIGFYGGEPLMNIEFIKEISEYALSINDIRLNLKFSMTTNAILLKKYIGYLSEKEFELLVSLDGDSLSHSYRTFPNGKPSFDIVLHNVDYVKSHYPDYFQNHVSFNAVLNDHSSVSRIYHFIYNRYGKIPEITQLLNKNVRNEKMDAFNKMFLSKKNSENEYLNDNTKVIQSSIPHVSYSEEYVDFIKDYSICSLLPTDFINDQLELYYPADTCMPFSLKTFMTRDNKILPCERINQDFFLGEIQDEVKIDFKKVAEIYNGIYKSIANVCGKCLAYKSCGQCIFFMDKNTNSVWKDCQYFYDDNRFRLKKSKIFSFAENYSQECFNMIERIYE